MDTEYQHELTVEQWETLKALRLPLCEQRINHGPVLLHLIALGLAGFDGETPVLTPSGRKVLIRGSEKLLDLAA